MRALGPLLRALGVSHPPGTPGTIRDHTKTPLTYPPAVSFLTVSFLLLHFLTRSPMQSEGCCGVLRALRANSSTGVETLDLPLSVTPGRRGEAEAECAV